VKSIEEPIRPKDTADCSVAFHSRSMQRSESRLKRSLSIRSGSDNAIQRGGGAIQFARVTTDSALLQRFLRWSQDNYCQENILFWIAVQDFKKVREYVALEAKLSEILSPEKCHFLGLLVFFHFC
jgi:hypothetical protein